MSNEEPFRLIDQYGLPILRDDHADTPVIPHPLSFAGILNVVAKTYSYRWDEALRHLPENALAMRRDAYVKSLLQERKMPTVNRSWQLIADNPNDPRQKQAVQTLTHCIKRTKRWRRFLAYLMEAIWYGRYGAQVTWERQAIGNGQKAWVIATHQPVNGDKIQYAWDSTPVVFINSSGAGRYPSEFVIYTDRVPGLKLAKQNWREQFIIHTHEVDDADYFEGEMAGAVHGVGLRNSIYWAWWLRDEMLSWAVDFMKKVGTLGLLVFWYELGNKAAKSEAELNAKRASKDTALIMGRPSGKESATWGVDHFPAHYDGVQALQKMIQDYFESHMERLIVGQSLSAGTEGSGLGGTGVARLHENTKFQLLQFDADNLAETLTDDLVAPMLRLNVPDADFGVRFEFNVESPENADKMEAVSKAVSMGVTFKMDEVRELTGMSKPEEKDESIGGKAKNQSGVESDRASHYNLLEVVAQLYAKNPPFEAKHPRDGDGKFAEREWLRSHRRAWDGWHQTPDEFIKEFKDRLAPAGDDPIKRNKIITGEYAKIYLSDPVRFAWAGLAAYASQKVGMGLEKADLAANLGPDWARGDAAKIYVALAEGNLKIYSDIVWVYAAFQYKGIDQLLLFQDDIPPGLLAAFKKIDESTALRAQRNSSKADSALEKANELLAYHEQLKVLQPLIDKNAKVFREATPFTLHPLTGSAFNNIGDFSSFRDRWPWVQDMLSEWSAFQHHEPEAVKAFMNAQIEKGKLK